MFSNTREQLNTFRIDSKTIEDTDTDSGLNKDESKRQQRQLVDTVGQRGKPGEQIKCVVSVQMLTEGWDANNVTHILGLRAFGSQLLIEQMVGRGLRRMSYTIDPDTGHFPAEYVDVYGIPFSIVPFRGRPTAAKAPEDKPVYHVRALPERTHLEIKFPNVEGYVMHLTKNLIQVNFDQLEPMEIQPLQNPLATFVQPQVGFQSGRPVLNPALETVLQNRDRYYASTHFQTLAFEITRRVVYNLTEGSEGTPKLRQQSRGQLFPQVFAIVSRYLAEKVDFKGGDPRELGLETYTQRVIALLTTAIEPASFNGEPPLLPQLNRYQPTGSTASVNFTTRKPVKETVRSPVNVVVADTAKWEQSAAFVLESLPEFVVAYVKNDHLEFTIPYEYDGVPHHYEPDFILKLANGIHLVLEVKGFQDEVVKAKHQGARRWISAVNNWGKLGTWAFMVCTDVSRLRSQLVEWGHAQQVPSEG